MVWFKSSRESALKEDGTGLPGPPVSMVTGRQARLFEVKNRVHSRLVEQLDLEQIATVDKDLLEEEVNRAALALLDEEGLPLNEVERKRLAKELEFEIMGLGPLEPAAARAHLAASIYLQMALHPHIVHIVGHTEADHAATAEDVIEASRLARRAIDNALRGQPDMTADPRVQARCAELIMEAQVTLQAICSLAGPDAADPLSDAPTLARAVTSGILDAPQLKANRYALGQICTRIMDGANQAVDAAGKPLSEQQRLNPPFTKEMI